MAKIKTNTKLNPLVNPRSRAAKRATSPSIDLDKSIKDVSRATDANPALGISHGSAISKKKKKKQMTRGQRERQEKGLARAEAVMDQMEKKVGGAKDRLRKRQSRKGDWDDINHMTAEEQRKLTKAPGRGATSIPGQVRDSDGESDTVIERTAPEDPIDEVLTDGQVTNYSNDAPNHPTIQREESDLIT